jgi:hypothetical protein
MNSKLTRWTLGAAAVAALSAAAIVPASSASAATVPHTATATAAATGVWIPLQTYYGAATGQGDQELCALGYLTHWSKVYPSFPESDFRCYGPVYTPNYAWTSTLEIYL